MATLYNVNRYPITSVVVSTDSKFAELKVRKDEIVLFNTDSHDQVHLKWRVLDEIHNEVAFTSLFFLCTVS